MKTTDVAVTIDENFPLIKKETQISLDLVGPLLQYCSEEEIGAYLMLLPNLLYAELLSIFDCLTNFPSLPVRSGFDELFPVTTFLTVVQSHDTLISMFLYIT